MDAERVLYLSQVHGREARFYRKPEQRADLITLEVTQLGGSEPSHAYGVALRRLRARFAGGCAERRRDGNPRWLAWRRRRGGRGRRSRACVRI